MTRIYHDQFAKQCLAGFLAPFGTTEISREITSEVRQVDVWFEPHGGKLSIEAVPLQRFLSDKRIGLVCIVLSNNSKDFVDELCLRDTGLLERISKLMIQLFPPVHPTVAASIESLRLESLPH